MMNFLKEIRAHINSFETEFEAELHKFIDHLETKYQVPAPAVVPPPAPIGEVTPEPTFTAPTEPVAQPVETTNVTDSNAPVSADPAPVVDAPVVDPTPAPKADPEPTTKE
jgi:hypothetical protein